MVYVPIDNVGAFGIVRDLPPHELPPEVWSDGQNVRFRDNKIEKFAGHEQVFGTPGTDPYWALVVPTDTVTYWVYMSLTKAYVYNGTAHFDITRTSGDYSATAERLWKGGLLGSIPVFNNGVDDPQYWSATDTAVKLAPLTNWPANTKARILVPFKNYLVALGISEGANVFEHRVKWSDSADPGTLPGTWDETDATADAGENELEDTNAGLIRDAVVLGDILLIYKDQSTWGMQFRGDQFIFDFRQLFNETGILDTHCVAPIRLPGGGRYHFLMTGDDLVVHNGQTITSVVDRRWKKFLNSSIDTSNFKRSFVVTNPTQDEGWFCFPESGAPFPTLALVWNSVENAIGVRELSNVSFIATGPISGSEDTSWDSDSGIWNTDLTQWNAQSFRPFARDLLICNPTDTKFFHVDRTSQFDGSNMTSYVQRTGLAVVGQDRLGNPKVDIENRKLLKRLWIKAEGSPILVRAGAQEEVGGPIAWQAARTFTPGTDRFVDFTVSGRLLATEFSSTADANWKLHSYGLDIEILGQH